MLSSVNDRGGLLRKQSDKIYHANKKVSVKKVAIFQMLGLLAEYGSLLEPFVVSF